MPGVSCSKCAKRSGWLLTIPAFVLIPKCPMCLLAYITLAGAAFWSHSLVVAAAALGIVWALWRVAKPLIKGHLTCTLLDFIKSLLRSAKSTA